LDKTASNQKLDLRQDMVLLQTHLLVLDLVIQSLLTVLAQSTLTDTTDVFK
jgi:hypothetical protein